MSSPVTLLPPAAPLTGTELLYAVQNGKDVQVQASSFGGLAVNNELREIGPSLTTLNEVTRSPLDGTEDIRLATSGANWKIPLTSLVGLVFQATTSPNFDAINGRIIVYVDPTGSDSNSGSISSPFATLQHALDYLSKYDYAHLYIGFIQVNNGTYTVTTLDLPHIVNQPISAVGGNPTTAVSIIGNKSTPANVVLNYGTGVSARAESSGFYFDGFQINLIDTSDGFWAFGTSFIFIDDIIFNFNAPIAGNTNAINASRTGRVSIGFINQIIKVTVASGTAITFLFFAQDLAQIQDTGVTWTFTNTVSCLSAVASIGDEAVLFWGGGTLVNPGNLHGSQFQNGGFSSLGFGPGGANNRANWPGTTVGTASPPVSFELNDPPYKVYTPLNGGTVTITAVIHNNIINPAGTLATLTIILPGYAVNGERVAVSTSQTLSAITWQAATTFGGSAPTFVGAPTTMSASTRVEFTFNTSGNIWYIS